MKATIPCSARERMLLAARDLILSRGFAGMTVDSICAQAGVTKGGFFHHFGSKDGLGEAVLGQFWQDVAERQNQAGFKTAATPLDYVLGYLDHAIETYQDPVVRQGCMLAIFTMELSETNPRLYRTSAEYFQTWKAELVGMFRQLKEYLCVADFDAVAWSELFICTLEGALLLSKSSGDVGVTVRVLSLYKKELLLSLGVDSGQPALTQGKNK
ncbi:MAG TPA: TetR/AcrR family transcriptional regulator [Methylophilaceae bacterium]|nr:TetR/AcrR family transcriptional regulator [Methylophilaceae bacterium]